MVDPMPCRRLRTKLSHRMQSPLPNCIHAITVPQANPPSFTEPCISDPGVQLVYDLWKIVSQTENEYVVPN